MASFITSSLLLLAGLSHASSYGDDSLCGVIANQLPGRVSYPGTQGYNASQTHYYAAQERNLTPGCIFKPQSTQEVVQFIRIATAQGRGRRRDVQQFAIRSGGHMLWAGAANINGGPTVDMRGLNSMVISADKKTVSVGGGAAWIDLYQYLDPYNVTVAGGRVPGIGVGGFVTGGGVSFHARASGWGADNVYGYEVVLASGDVVYASATQNRDLWIALKGGSNNFGIITRFDLATIPGSTMWGGAIQMAYTPDALSKQATAFSNYMAPKVFDGNAEMSMILMFQNPGKQYAILNSLFYVAAVNNPPIYDEFRAAGNITVSAVGLSKVFDLSTSFGKILPPQVNNSFQLVYSFKHSDASTYQALFKAWEDNVKPLDSITGLGVQYLFQSMPVSNGTNSMGLPPNSKDILMGVVTGIYPNSADTEKVKAGISTIVESHKKLLKAKGLLIDFLYLNYADGSQDAISSYGADKKAALQAASRKYDPRGVFQKQVSGKFKLF